MIFDGVFERHRALRGAAVELGAGWVPSWMRRLDWSAHIWRKEPDLAALTRKPSEIVREHLAFTPFVYEDVGQLIRESDDGLYLFSSDYPHYEGSKNPIERFEGATLETRPASASTPRTSSASSAPDGLRPTSSVRSAPHFARKNSLRPRPDFSRKVASSPRLIPT